MEKSVKAQLILENNVVFHGKAIGHIRETIGKIVFSTSMVGYEEILTDPAYIGKIVCMTYPLIGNYGINLDDIDSDKPKISGLVVREICRHPSNWRLEMELLGYLNQSKIMGIEDIDTRSLTKMIRREGQMKAIITVRGDEMTKSQIATKFDSFHYAEKEDIYA